MSSWGDDAALDIYRRAFDIMELDPDPDTDGYIPANTAGSPPRSRVWPPRPPQDAQERGEDHDLRQERDDLKAALRDALATNRAQAAKLREMTINARVLAVVLVLTLGCPVLFAWRG